ncbi:MAG: D-TA family PLP-dependent enzyme [Cyclobacteriaceae bacterium]
MKDWYTIRNAESLDTPALVLYPDRIRNNIKILKTFVSDTKQLRPHIKTNKCPEVVRLMLEGGISKFKCATIAEAEMLAIEGAKDVLLAYQPVGPKAKRFCELQRAFTKTIFSCLIDNQKSLLELSALAGDYNMKIRVLIDVNAGMNRTGIAPGEEAFRLYRAASQTAGIDISGLHVYDGHLRDADLAQRKEKCDQAFQEVDSLRRQIVAAIGKMPIVVAGGTPTFPIHAKRNGVEVSPGTFIFWDKSYQQLLAEQPFEFAALVVSRVISKPGDQTICVDLGHKSIAAENPINNRVHFLNAPDIQPIGHSEEHMVFHTQNAAYKVGDVFYGVPYHICPTVALYEEASVCRENKVIETWPILARKRKLTI